MYMPPIFFPTIFSISNLSPVSTHPPKLFSISLLFCLPITLHSPTPISLSLYSPVYPLPLHSPTLSLYSSHLRPIHPLPI